MFRIVLSTDPPPKSGQGEQALDREEVLLIQWVDDSQLKQLKRQTG